VYKIGLRVRRVVEWCVRRRKTVILLTIAAFVGSIALFRFVPQQFFPASGRPELMVDLKLAEGASLGNTTERVKQLEALLKHFGSVKKLRAARVEEIEQVPGFGRALSEKVAAALQSQQEDAAPAVNMTTGEVLS
jgi:multidrug efflux pump subunit AcrB